MANFVSVTNIVLNPPFDALDSLIKDQVSVFEVVDIQPNTATAVINETEIVWERLSGAQGTVVGSNNGRTVTVTPSEAGPMSIKATMADAALTFDT